MKPEEAFNRSTDRVRLPYWHPSPEGTEAHLCQIRVESRYHGLKWQGLVEWYVRGMYSEITGRADVIGGETWFDLEELELVETPG